MELPGEWTGTESNDVLIWKCPPDEDPAHLNVCVYDGVFDLKSGEVGEIERSLAQLNWLISMMFFPYGATYSWRNKYRMVLGGTGLLKPTHDELRTVDVLLKQFPYGEYGMCFRVESIGTTWGIPPPIPLPGSFATTSPSKAWRSPSSTEQNWAPPGPSGRARRNGERRPRPASKEVFRTLRDQPDPFRRAGVFRMREGTEGES